MKKRSFKAIVMACLMVLAMGLTACGDGKVNGKYATMKAYVESDEAQAELKSVPTDDSMEISLTADGNKMIYTYKFTQIEKTDEMAALLEAGLKDQETVFYNTATALKRVVNIDKPIVTVRYIDKNDKVIFSRDFEAK